jgi:hypothetical protein
MQKLLIAGAATIAVLASGPTDAADFPVKVPAPTAYDWTGFYVGGQIGGATGTANFADPFGASIFGDKVITPGFFAGGQIGYNWQVPDSRWVLGVQADANWLTADGTNTCFAFSGSFVSATCHADPKSFGTLTGRGGFAVGPAGRTLLYLLRASRARPGAAGLTASRDPASERKKTCPPCNTCRQREAKGRAPLAGSCDAVSYITTNYGQKISPVALREGASC